MNSLVDALPKLAQYAALMQRIDDIEDENHSDKRSSEIDALQTERLALEAELKSDTDLLLEAACYVQRELTFEARIVHDNYNAFWGLIYPDTPDSWEYPAQIIRHIRDVLREKDAEIEQAKKLAEAYRMTTEDYEGFVRSCIKSGETPKSYRWFVDKMRSDFDAYTELDADK